MFETPHHHHQRWPPPTAADKASEVESWVLICREYLRGQHSKQKNEEAANNRRETKEWELGVHGQRIVSGLIYFHVGLLNPRNKRWGYQRRGPCSGPWGFMFISGKRDPWRLWLLSDMNRSAFHKDKPDERWRVAQKSGDQLEGYTGILSRNDKEWNWKQMLVK